MKYLIIMNSEWGGKYSSMQPRPRGVINYLCVIIIIYRTTAVCLCVCDRGFTGIYQIIYIWGPTESGLLF